MLCRGSGTGLVGLFGGSSARRGRLAFPPSARYFGTRAVRLSLAAGEDHARIHIRPRATAEAVGPAAAVEPVAAAEYFCKTEARRPGQWVKPYLQLGKHRLSALVVMTAMAGYYVAGGALLDPTFPVLVVGTTLQSLSANGFNQVMERTHDALMKRTALRPCVTGDLTVPRAVLVSTAELAIGTALLYYAINPLTAALGVATHLLYTLCYTPLKRWHWLNTWVGAIVGALPPVMGCAAALNAVDLTGVFLGGLLFLWQMPHFLSLSYLCRRDYAHAGFRMLASEDPQRAADYSLDHSLMMLVWCLPVAAAAGFSYPFLGGCLLLNLGMVYLSQQYHLAPGIVTARRLFRFTLVFLIVVLAFAAWDRPVAAEQTEADPVSASV